MTVSIRMDLTRFQVAMANAATTSVRWKVRCGRCAAGPGSALVFQSTPPPSSSIHQIFHDPISHGVMSALQRNTSRHSTQTSTMRSVQTESASMLESSEQSGSECIYAMRIGGVQRCTLKLCKDQDLGTCCESCTEYAGPNRGLGDVVKNITSAVGIKPCGGCQKRREAMNRWTRRRREQSRDS